MGFDRIRRIRLSFFHDKRDATLAGSGGHVAGEHRQSPSDKPPADGTWEIMEGTPQNPITHPTGSINGNLVVNRTSQVSVTYEAGEFSGMERVTMYGVPPNFPAVTTQKELKQKLKALEGTVCEFGQTEINVRVVRVPDLVRMEDQPGANIEYVLNGTDPDLADNHPERHYLKRNVAESLDSAARSIRTASWNTNNELLRLNDMSLVWGGRFDIRGKWNGNHGSHRLGVDVDIENRPLFDLNEYDFILAMYRSGWDWIDEHLATNYPHFRYVFP